MDFTFSNALAQLGPNAAFRMINQARPPANYLFATILPEQTRPDYKVETGQMTVRSTMAGLVAMDSPYPPGTVVDVSTFLEQTAKLGISQELTERALRTLQGILMQLQISGGSSNEAMVQEALNFTQALLIQPQLDATEWLRGQALANGAIDWTFNKKQLSVDYGVPSANKLATRSGTAGYGGSASNFWADIRAAKKLLKYNVRAFIAHPDTIDMIVSNANNNAELIGQDPSTGTFTLRKLVGTNQTASTDNRDTVTLIGYGLEGEIINPTDTTTTQTIPFMPTGKIIAIGNNTGTRYVVGAGSRTPNDVELGYTHVAPTVEGSGALGRWARVYTPEGRPWSLAGDSAANVLPVIEAPNKIVILSTAMV